MTKILLKTRLSFFVFLFILPYVNAQHLRDHKLYGLEYKIYRLDSTQARVLYQQGKVTDTIDLFKNEFTTKFTDSTFDLNTLPKGHYLIAKAKGQLVFYESFESSYFKITSYGYNGEAWFVISDYQGNILEDATLEINKESYNYRADCNCYPVPGVKGNGFGKITHQDQFTYIHIDGYKPPKEKFKNKKTKYKNKVFSSVRILPGYIAFNKPKYQLADTVKMKAFLVKENGKPWKRKVKLKIFDDYGHESEGFHKHLKPVSEGAFVYNFPIPDTFEIDQSYIVEIYSKRNKLLKNTSFRIEDYELGNTSFSASLEKSTVFLGGAPTLILEGKDANDLPLLDAHAKVSVKMTNFIDYYRDSIYISDFAKSNLFNTEFLLDVSGPTRYEIPPSIFPLIKASYSIDVTLNNSENEPKTFNFSFTYDGIQERHELYLDQDSIKANYLLWDTVSPGCKATLTSYYNNTVLEEKEVSLPFSEKLNYAATLYTLKDQLGNKVCDLYTPYWVDKLVYAEGVRKHDSIYIDLHNELQIPISWQIYKGSEKIEGGKSADLQFAVADNTLDYYYIVYTFRWQDKDLVREKAFHIDEKRLNVEIDQPTTIFPGTEVPITVKVTDYKASVMKEVNLTAWSVNTKFGDISGPDLPYFGLQHFDLLRPFEVKHQAFKIHSSDSIRQKHIDLLELYNTPYYKFIYSKGGVNTQFDSIHSSWGEINPFVFTKGNLERIFTIYANDQPIYIQDNYVNQPMTIKLKPGSYNIKIRTKYDLYEVADIPVKPALKTMLCINTDSIYNNPDAAYIKLDSLPYLTQEQERLKRSMLMVAVPRYSNLYFDQDSIIFHLNGTGTSYYDDEFGSYYSIGPFKKGEINVTDPINDTSYSFYFEPGYLYTINKDTSYVLQPIAYPNPFNSYYPNSFADSWDFREKSIDIPKVMQPEKDPVVVQQQKIEEIKNRKAKQHPLLKTRYHLKQYGKSRCEIQFQNKTQKSMLWAALFNHENDSCTHIKFGNFVSATSLYPGKYDVFMLFDDSSYIIQKDKELRTYGVNYFRYDASYLKPYDQNVLDQYEQRIIALNKPPLRKFTSPPLEINGFTVKYKKSENNKTMISGYLFNYHGEPIDYATIYAEIKGYFKGGAITNQEGYFEIQNIPAGDYMLKIMLSRNQNFNLYNVKVPKNQNTQLMIEPEILMEYFNEVGYSEEAAYNYYADEAKSMATVSGTLLYESVSVMSEKKGIFSISKKDISALPSKLEVSSVLSTVPGVSMDEENLGKFGKEGINALREDPNTNKIRNTFRDYGFWEPNLITDKNGEAHFSVTYPDNITQWKTIVPAMDGHKNTGIGYAYSKSFKPLSANLGLPNFLVKGDEAMITGKVLNYTEDPIAMRTYFKVNGTETFTNNIKTATYAIDHYTLEKNSPGMLKIVYGLDKGDGYIDGEERDLEVISDGVASSDLSLFEIQGDTSMTWLPNEQITGRTLFITNQPLDIIKQELEDLKDYQYGCNEQTASKLKALLLEKSLMSNLNEPFKDEKLLVKCLKTLEKNQNKDGSWGWWDQSNGDLWITAYVTDAINKAVSAGYRSKSHMQGSAFLHARISELDISEKLEVLNTLSSIPYPMDYAAQIKNLEQANLSFQDKLLLTKLKLSQGNEVNTDFIFEQQKQAAKGVFWGEQMFDFTVNKMQTSMLVYDILKTLGGHEETLKKIRSHFLNYKVNAKNTIEQSTMLDRFMSDMVAEASLQESFIPEIKINGIKRGNEFPIEIDFKHTDTVKFEKVGAPLKLYSYEHKETRSPLSIDTVFEISRKFYQEGKEVTSLKLAEPLIMEIEVIVRKPSKYVLLELPLPAACSYGGGVPQKNPHEEFRKNYKNKTAIACRNLSVGRHKFQVQLVPRFAGSYNVPPAKVQLMYFQDISSYTPTNTLEVIE